MAVDPRQIQLLEETLRGMSLDQILTAARPNTPIQTGVVPGQQPRGVGGNIMDRFADSGLPEIPGTLADIGRNATPNLEMLNAAFASGQPPEEQGVMGRMLGLPAPTARPQGGAPDFLREGNFGKFSESDRALFNRFSSGTPAARAASYTPFGITLGTNPVSEAALSVSGPGIRMGSKIVGGGLDLLGLGIDAGKAIPATFGQEEPHLGEERSQKRLGRKGIPFDLPKYIENIRDEQKIKEEGGRGGIYMDTMLKKWSEPGYIEALQAEGGTNEQISKEMSDELAFAGVTGDWTDFISDILLLEGAARTPQVLAKIAKNSRRVTAYRGATAKRELSLADRANRDRNVFIRGKNAGQVERAGQVGKGREIAASDEVRLQDALKQKWEKLGEQQKLDAALRKGPMSEAERVEAFKAEIRANADVAAKQGEARKLQAEGGAQGMFGRKLEQQAGEKEQGIRKLFGKPFEGEAVKPIAKPKPKAKKKAPKIFQQKETPPAAPAADDKMQAVRDAVKKMEASKGKSAPEKIKKKPSVKIPDTVAPAAKAPKGNKIKQGAAKAVDEKKARQVVSARNARVLQLEKQIASLEESGATGAAKAENFQKSFPLKQELAKLKSQQTSGKVVSEEAAEVARAAGEAKVEASPEYQAALKDALARVERSKAGNVVKKGGAKGKKKIVEPVVEETPAAAGKSVEEMSEAELISKMVEDLGVGLSTKDVGKLKKADAARKAAFREFIKRYANPSDAKKALMDTFKLSSKVADEIIAKGTAPIPGTKVKAPSIFGAKAADAVITGEGAAAKVIEETATPLEAVTKSIVGLARTEKKFVQTEAIDDAARAVRSIATVVNKPSIFKKGVKVTPKALVASLEEQGMSNKEIVNVLTKLNTPAAGSSRVAGATTQSDDFVKSALKIATGKKQPGTVIKEPFKQNILEKSAAKNVAKPSVREADTVGDIGKFGPDVGKPVSKPEADFNPFKRNVLQDKEQFKKTFPFTGKSTSKAEALAASQSPAAPQVAQTKKGVATGKNLPTAKPKARVDEPSIKKVMKGEVSYDEYRTFKRTQQAERKAAMAKANREKLAANKKYDADSPEAKQLAKDQALYDNARSKENFAQQKARHEETNYYTEEALKKNIKQELYDLRLQLKRVERAKGRGVAAKKRSIQKKIDALVTERENISTIQRTRVGELGPTASKDEIRFQTLIDAEQSLKDQLRVATSGAEKADLRIRIAGFKVEQDAMIQKLAGSKQFVAEADKLTIKEAMRNIKEAFKANVKEGDIGMGLSTKDVSKQELKKQNLLKLVRMKAREYKRNEMVREFALRAQRAGKSFEEFADQVHLPAGKPLTQVTKRDLVRRARETMKQLEVNGKIGNLQFGRHVANGAFEPEIAEFIASVYKEDPHLFDVALRRAVGNVAVRQETYSYASRKVGKQFYDLTDAQMSSVFSMPMSDALMMTNSFIEGNMPAELAKQTVKSLLINYDRGGALLGRAMNARKGLFKYEQLIADIRKMGAKGMTSKEAEQAALDMLHAFGKYRKDPTKWQQVYDIYQTYSVNNILGAGVTFSRNLVGATTEVFINQPKERIFRALYSQLGKLPGFIADDAVSMREILPEIKALYHNLPTGIETGARFALRGTTQGVLSSMAEEMKWLEKFAKGKPRWLQRQVQKRIHRVLGQQENLLEFKASTRTGEVFTGKEGSSIIKLGQKLRDSDRALTRALGVGTQVGGAYIDIPVRGLLAADAILQESSYQGHKMATRWRRASKMLRSNKGGKIKKDVEEVFEFGKLRKRKIYNVLDKDGKILMKDIGGTKLSTADKAEALEDALVYMYRAPFKSHVGQILEKAIRHRGLNNVFLFAKTRTNILKAALARNPITGLMNTTWKSAKSTIAADQALNKGKPFLTRLKHSRIHIDTKSLAKVTNGMATMMWMKWQADRLGGQFVGPSKTQAERKTRLATGLSELYYEHVKGDPSKGVSDLSNMSPLTPEVAQIAAWTRFQKEVDMGKGNLAAAMKSFGSFADAMLQDSMYSDVEGITRFISGWAGKGADPNIPMSERLALSVSRTFSSRLSPNRGRETRQSGKFLGVNFPWLKKDNTVIQPDTGNPLKTFGQTFLHDRFSQLDTSDIGRKKNVLTGENIERAPRYAPRLRNVLATLHPAFLPTKRIPDSHLSANELKVGRLLSDYDVGLPLAPKSVSLGGEQFGLTIKEQKAFIGLMTTKERGSMHDTVMKEMLRLERRVRRREGKPSYKFIRYRKEIQNKLRKMKTEVNKQILPDVTIRLYKTAAGRERLWSTLHHEKVAWKDDELHRRKLKRIISRANFWVGSDVRRLQIP